MTRIKELTNKKSIFSVELSPNVYKKQQDPAPSTARDLTGANGNVRSAARNAREVRLLDDEFLFARSDLACFHFPEEFR